MCTQASTHAQIAPVEGLPVIAATKEPPSETLGIKPSVNPRISSQASIMAFI